MATTTIEQEVLDLEKRYWEALKNNDMETALSLTDDPCIVTGAQGVMRLDHRTFREMMKSPGWALHSFELNDLQVRLLGDDVAIVAYKVREELTVEGKPVTLDAADASTWVRRNGGWVCALHTESVAGDAFGRDRQPGGKAVGR